jgi:hypothetical protein
MSEAREPREVILSASSAHETASQIRSYWSNLGNYNVNVTVVPISFGKHTIHCVRSDLSAGLPRNFRREDFSKIKADMASWRRWISDALAAALAEEQASK